MGVRIFLPNKDVNHYIFGSTANQIFEKGMGVIKGNRGQTCNIVTPGNYQDGLTMKRGLSESYSLLQTVTVHGSEPTLQELPITRAHGLYFMSRDSRSEGGFLGESENEIAVLWRGSKDKFDYVDRKTWEKRRIKYGGTVQK